MLLGKLDLFEQTELEFGLEVFGTSEQTQSVRFVIEGGEFEILCKCNVANGEVKAIIPKLKGILPAGVYEARLEAIVGDKIFFPLREQIEFNPLVEFDVKTKKVEQIKEGVKVTTKSPIVSEDSKVSPSRLEQNIKKAISQGFEVSKINEQYIMKHGDKYIGIISENTILTSDEEHDTLLAMVEHLSESTTR